VYWTGMLINPHNQTNGWLIQKYCCATPARQILYKYADADAEASTHACMEKKKKDVARASERASEQVKR